MPFSPLKISLTSLILSLGLVPIVRWVAYRNGWVSQAKDDRWSKRPAALLGGVAIYLAYLVPFWLYVPARLNNLWSVAALGGLLFLLGLIDDFRTLRPSTKLIGQIVGAASAVWLGHTLSLTGSPLFDIPLSIFWMVAITNAFNLIDNMDGLAAGVAAISLAFMAGVFLREGQGALIVASFSLLGALLGFLAYNFNPASIFMGDSGSLFIGMTIAILSVHGASKKSALATVAVPFLILLVPLLDITLVSATRVLTGRAISQGGKDHSSHRLVLLGLSERKAVLVLYGLALAAGASALWIDWAMGMASLLALAAIVIGFSLFGLYLSQMSFVAEKGYYKSASKEGATALLFDLTFKRRIFEIVLDLILIVFSYCLAYGLRFDFLIPPSIFWAMTKSLPLIVGLTVGSFFVAGVYRGIWRFTGVEEIYRILLGSFLAVLSSVFLVVFIYRFEHFSRSVFPLFGMILAMSVIVTRLSFKLLSHFISSLTTPRGSAAPVLIYGAGDQGEATLAELRKQNGGGAFKPIGFLDDDERKHGQIIHEVPVLGDCRNIEKIFKKSPFSHLVLASHKIAPENVAIVRDFCRNHNIALKRFKWVSEDVP